MDEVDKMIVDGVQLSLEVVSLFEDGEMFA